MYLFVLIFYGKKNVKNTKVLAIIFHPFFKFLYFLPSTYQSLQTTGKFTYCTIILWNNLDWCRMTLLILKSYFWYSQSQIKARKNELNVVLNNKKKVYDSRSATSWSAHEESFKGWIQFIKIYQISLLRVIIRNNILF